MYGDESLNARADNLWEKVERAEEERRKRVTYVVAIYELDRAYGGPEEGGWWYDTGSLVRVMKVVKGETRAYAVAARINRLLSYRRSCSGARPIDSVAYDGGHCSALVYERNAPESFPTHRPFYE